MSGLLGRNRNTREDYSSSDDENEDEEGRLQAFFTEYIFPWFTKDKKWFWWNIGFFSVSTAVVATHGFGLLDGINNYLIHESKLDKALQKQLMPQRM